MVESSGSSLSSNSIEWLAEYHSDVLAALKIYFMPGTAYFRSRSYASSAQKPSARLLGYLEETNLRSSLAILSSIEAAFRQDYLYRCNKKLKDDLSKAFRAIYKLRQSRVSLDEDIFEAWNTYTSGANRLIGILRGAFRFRHWLAHGRYWKPKLGRTYDFEYLYLLAKDV
jgi:hypothetical protein